MAPPEFPREEKDEDYEEEEEESDETSLTGEDITDSDFERQLSAIEAAHADIRKRRVERKDRFKLLRSEYQEIIDQMERSLEKAEAANVRYQNALRLLDDQCNHSVQVYKKISRSAQTSRSPSPQYCELSLSRGRAESEPVSSFLKNPKSLRSVDKFPKRLSACNVADSVGEACHASSPDTNNALQISPAKSDSSSDSSRASGSTSLLGMQDSEAVTKKPPPFVPRLDLSGTGAGAGVGTSMFQQKPSQLQCDQFENITSRRTYRRPNSARLISLDDHFGTSTDSARTMLSRIKRRAKGGSCGGEIGGPINEVSVSSCGRSSPSDNNTGNSIGTKPSDDVVHSGLDIADGPSIREIVESAIPESVSTEITCKDGALRTPVHELRRSMSPPVAKRNPDSEISVSCNAALSTPSKAQENVDGDAVNSQAMRQESRTQILLWSTGEKLLTLQTLNNTMFLWEDHPAKCGTLTSSANVDLVLSSLTAAKESQRRLFDSLNGVQGVPRCAICCSAVRDLVRAYPPEKLVPTSFINDHFVTKFLQHSYVVRQPIESKLQVIDKSLVSAKTLRSAQDSEAAEFWQALMHHIVSVVDHKMVTAEQSATEFAEVLLHEMREPDIIGDAKIARLELQAFLAQCFRLEPAPGLPPQGKEPDTTDLVLLVSDTERAQESSSLSLTEEIVLNRPERNIVVTLGNSNPELPRVASKHSRKSSLSIFNSLKFWKRKPQKLETEIDYLSMLGLNQGMDRSERPQTRHDPKKYEFSLKI